MARIFKYEIPHTEKKYNLVLPVNSVLIHLGSQNGKICIWAEIDPDETEETIIPLEIIGTGWGFESEGKYHLGTVQMGNFVWHIYEVYDD